MATLEDVARRAGVSAQTVSRVINNAPHVSARRREAVERAIAELDYRPNAAARSLASAKSYVIGVLGPRLGTSYFRRLHSEVLGACRARGYHLVVEQLDNDWDASLVQARRFVGEMRLDGLLLAPGIGDSPDILDLLAMAGIRAVALSPRSGSRAALVVRADEAQGERELAERLWEMGHRRFAVATPPASWRLARGEAFALRLDELGAAPGTVVRYPFDWRVPGLEGGRRMAIDILADSVRPTAVYAASDELAAGAIGLCLTRGVSVPDDISIAGFDDDEIGQAVWPALTTIRQPLDTMIDHAMNLLVGSERTRSAADILCPVELMLRDSIGPVAAADGS